MIMMMMAVLAKDKEAPTCPCLVTQCLRTESTLMVAALDVIDIFLFAEARNASLFAWVGGPCPSCALLHGYPSSSPSSSTP